MRIAICFFLFAIILIPGVHFAQDEPAADTVRADSLWTTWDGQTLALDTASTPQNFARGWLFPIGLIIATGTAVFLLFSTRSR